VVFNLLDTYSSFLTEDIIALRKNLTLAARGTYKKLERWKRCTSAAESAVGMAVGALFVNKTFSDNSYTVVSKHKYREGRLFLMQCHKFKLFPI